MTSIEWFISELEKVNYHPTEAMVMYVKKLHKQDIISAYAFGHNDGCRYMTNDKQEFEHGEGYYQETFKKD
jgi:predicted transcriptional regulator